jgi:hypothetical protein
VACSFVLLKVPTSYFSNSLMRISVFREHYLRAVLTKSIKETHNKEVMFIVPTACFVSETFHWI